jgi:hypothetical protein
LQLVAFTLFATSIRNAGFATVRSEHPNSCWSRRLAPGFADLAPFQ